MAEPDTFIMEPPAPRRQLSDRTRQLREKPPMRRDAIRAKYATALDAADRLGDDGLPGPRLRRPCPLGSLDGPSRNPNRRKNPKEPIP